ncbi:MAG: hypothetical protein JWP81_860 [Ferruginibacter sp.]|nr:hypothetical protein [Ferruginibacter sp.]
MLIMSNPCGILVLRTRDGEKEQPVPICSGTCDLMTKQQGFQFKEQIASFLAMTGR